MSLIKCPSCKNIVSNESYCCPRCGRGFRAMRIKRVLLMLIVVAVGAWIANRYWIHWKIPWL